MLLEIETLSQCTTKKLSEVLTMDEGYLSRILKKFQVSGLLQRFQSSEDGRIHFLSLTEKGKAELAELSARSDEQIRSLIAPLSSQEISKLTQSMDTIESLMSTLPIRINQDKN